MPHTKVFVSPENEEYNQRKTGDTQVSSRLIEGHYSGHLNGREHNQSVWVEEDYNIAEHFLPSIKLPKNTWNDRNLRCKYLSTQCLSHTLSDESFQVAQSITDFLLEFLHPISPSDKPYFS